MTMKCNVVLMTHNPCFRGHAHFAKLGETCLPIVTIFPWASLTRENNRVRTKLYLLHLPFLFLHRVAFIVKSHILSLTGSNI